MTELKNDYKNIKNVYSTSKKELNSFLIDENILDEYNNFKKINSKKFSNPYKLFLLKRDLTISMKNEITDLYNSGYGIKAIAKELNLSYTVSRHFLSKVCDINLRTGKNVVTDKLIKIRSENAKKQKEEKSGFFKQDIRDSLKITSKTNRGVQGYYFNKSKLKYVWLRSTYEYIFAKWLDKIGHIWDVECKTFILPNGETYRPDFFIFENNEVVKIIEIKGFFDINKYKPIELNKLIENVEVILIDFTNTSIKCYCDLDYKTELNNWKKERKKYEN